VSAAIKTAAVNLSKMSNDLRLLSSGPRAGIGEINLPAKQNGSSIMPGKVNPVIPEVVSQVAFRVIGNDLTITMAAESGSVGAECLRTDHFPFAV
jgi:aspartate ammonia-lyase